MVNVKELRKNLYLENGYLNMPAIIETGVPFIMITGGRGTGKTFGALKYVKDNRIKFMFLRRTNEQTRTISSHEYSVFNAINRKDGTEIYPYTIGRNTIGFCHSVWNDAKDCYECASAPIGYLASLTGISKMRGFDAESIKICILDEFCPELHEKAIKNEETAVANAYETINRNRELEGQKPLQFLMLANANNIRSKILSGFGLVEIMERMFRKGQSIYLSKDENLLIICPKDSPISERKKDTALYKVMAGTQYEKMALQNEFAMDGISNINPQPLKEYRPIVKVGQLTVYRHKSKDIYYISPTSGGNVQVYKSDSYDLMKFRRTFHYLESAYINNKILYESTETCLLFTSYLLNR